MQSEDMMNRFDSPPLARRNFLMGLSCVLIGSRASSGPAAEDEMRRQLEEIQSRIGGRLGVHVLDKETGTRIGFNDSSRFAMASTFKWLLAAAVLARVDAQTIEMDERLSFGKEDLLDYAPVAAARLAQGHMKVSEACAAMVEVSDNTAANLLLRRIGGPQALTQFLRGIGDNSTRLDRMEPELNTNEPGDERDTTTPRAMVQSLETLLLGTALTAVSREQLIDWLVASRTGLKRIRAGLPADWKAGDKTGTGSNGAVNDVAIAWPPGRRPVLIAIYLTGSTLPTEQLNAAHAEIAALCTNQAGL